MKRQLTLRINGEEISVVAFRDGDTIHIERDGETHTVQLVSESYAIPVSQESSAPTSTTVPAPSSVGSPTPAPVGNRQTGGSKPGAVGGAVVSPMVGLVKDVVVNPGDTVASGDRLVILEAMKMEIDVVAHAAGVVAEVLAQPGQNVTEGQPLVRVESGIKE